MQCVDEENAEYMIEFRVIEEDGFDYIDYSVFVDNIRGIATWEKRYKAEHPEGCVIDTFQKNIWINRELQDWWCIRHTVFGKKRYIS